MPKGKRERKQIVFGCLCLLSYIQKFLVSSFHLLKTVLVFFLSLSSSHCMASVPGLSKCGVRGSFTHLEPLKEALMRRLFHG